MRWFLTLCVCAGLSAGANAQESNPLKRSAPPDAEVYFLAPGDQDTVPATFRVMFGLRGMGVAPTSVDVPNTGHHHLLIDQPDSLDYEQPLPSAAQVVHFGKGQTAPR